MRARVALLVNALAVVGCPMMGNADIALVPEGAAIVEDIPPQGSPEPTGELPSGPGGPGGLPGATGPSGPELAGPWTITISKIKGKVKVNGKSPKKGEVVNDGDQLATPKNGTLDLQLSDGTRARLRGKAVLERKERTLRVKLLSGKLYASVAPGTVSEIDTGFAIATAGEAKLVIEQRTKKTYYCVSAGELRVQRPAKGAPEHTVKAGQEFTLEKSREAKSPSDAVEAAQQVDKELQDLQEP